MIPRILTIMFVAGFILLCSDGRWFPWPNLCGFVMCMSAGKAAGLCEGGNHVL